MGFEGAGYDYMDEYEAYEMMDIYNPNSVSSVLDRINYQRRKRENDIGDVEFLDLRKLIEFKYEDRVKHAIWKQIPASK